MNCARNLALALLLSIVVARAVDTNGFAVKFTSGDGKVTDYAVLPNLWLFVGAGKPATPFIPPGRFTAEFNGFISAELRGTRYFAAEQLAGALKIEINGNTVLDANGVGNPSPITKAIQLNKGPNAVKATFTSSDRDSFFRVGWTEKGTNVIPIPNTAITQARIPEVQNAERVYAGRELFLEHRCAACHKEKYSTPVAELAMDAPSFDGIGERRGIPWLARWVLDPKAARSQVAMPRILHGASAAEDANAIAAYLSLAGRGSAHDPNFHATRVVYPALNEKALREISARSGHTAKPTLADVGDPSSAPEGAAERKPLFERLNCAGCHNVPGAKETDDAKLSLNHVVEKFSAPSLIDFLKAPERHFAWIRMPNFKLADTEATELADYLWKNLPKAKEEPKIEVNAAVAARGKKLIQTLGCLNCHVATGLENQHAALPLARVGAATNGCLARMRGADSKAPDFGFTVAERDALLSFLKTDRSSLNRQAPMEFAGRQTRLLQCGACHGKIELVPPMEILGGKLRPEWSAAFLAGEPFKARADIHPRGGDWVPARMPTFRSRAQLLAEGMAAQQGYGPRTADGGPVDQEAAKIGQRMAGKDNGLSCISCHAINDLQAMEVFESEGINLGLTDARLLKPYFFRWMRNPLAVDPQTKMPAFFDEEGRSALTDYYEGDGEKQINALYQYMRLREAMPKPNTGQ